MLYNSLLFVHVLAVIAWMGSTIALAVFTSAAVRRDGPELASLGRVAAGLGGFFGGTAGVAFLAGLGMMFTDAAPEWSAAWINVGFLATIIAMVLGARVIGPKYALMAEALEAGDSATAAAERKVAAGAVHISLLLLTLTVAAMVFKWGS